MNSAALAILRTGLVTSVGLSAPTSCAAIRAKISNPRETRFMDASGEWIMGHTVPLDQPWRGDTRLAKMAALVIEECLEDIPRGNWAEIPLLLCVAERERPGRLPGLEDALLAEIQRDLGTTFAKPPIVIPQGRVGVATALTHAKDLCLGGTTSKALIVSTDTLLTWTTLSAYERESRLLRAGNSNGFMPGEGAAGLLVGNRLDAQNSLWLCGLGTAIETSTINSDEPLRALGLTAAITQSLDEAGYRLHELDFRITDLSGEQYYFREAALAVSRLMRVRREEFDIWHPAECIGETGAVAGVAALVVAEAACRKAYAPGPRILCHAANDTGERMAAVLCYGVS